jgi:5-(carboxyamino)imidazole ribonucleotide synthase
LRSQADNPDDDIRHVGILGGGQLARMMALAGIPLGLEFHFLDPSGSACASRLGKLHQAEFSDLSAIRAMAAEIDVATFDFENVPAASARSLASEVTLLPCVSALESCQDRLLEKRLLQSLGIPVAAFRSISSRTDLLSAVDSIGLPAMLKTRRLGYDGRGQARLNQHEDLEPAWQALGQSDLILEAFVPFTAECSLITVRSESGDVRYWPLTKSVHANGVLQLSQPGILPIGLQAEAEGIVSKLLRHWEYVGVLAVEFFVVQGGLLVNEMAPRVHNSGHWTLDAAVTSQFENHLRAICGFPLGDTAMTDHALMFNWISELPDMSWLLTEQGLHWHDYGKIPRQGRKLGHATLVGRNEQDLMQRASRIAAGLGGHWPELLTRLQSPT